MIQIPHDFPHNKWLPQYKDFRSPSTNFIPKVELLY